MDSSFSVPVDGGDGFAPAITHANAAGPMGGVAEFGPETRFVICLDGTILSNGHAAVGAVAFLRAIAGRYMLISNNSRDTGRSMSEKLKRAGISVPDSCIILAGEQTVHAVAERYPKARCIILASRVLSHAAHRAGLVTVPNEAEVVLVGRDSTWTYQRLAQIANEVARGAVLVGTNAETTLIAANGQIIPDTGSIIAAVEAVTGRRAVCMFDKSLAPLVRMAVQRLECDPSDVVVVGVVGSPVLETAAESALRVWPIQPGERHGFDGFAAVASVLGGQAA